MIDIPQYQQAILNWYQQFGRKDLPWQQHISPYRVWVSEIMLQQTQVTTVIPYFYRFMERFPDVKTLALANIDEVLHYWSGLGYYARARNLHKAAKIIVEKFKGDFPNNLDDLTSLSGIGTSTAGAILSFSMNISASILDGNVKRVLSRLFAIEQWSGLPKILQKLWEIAIKLTPRHHTAQYNQAMMDLGAMVCTRSKPKCLLCPLTSFCEAYQQDKTTHYPVAKPKRILRKRTAYFLMMQNNKNEILLVQRPAAGIWGGLWCLPEYDSLENLIQESPLQFHYKFSQHQELSAIFHAFTHFQLTLVPIHVRIKSSTLKVFDATQQIWYKKNKNQAIGLPAPIQRILENV